MECVAERGTISATTAPATRATTLQAWETKPQVRVTAGEPEASGSTPNTSTHT